MPGGLRPATGFSFGMRRGSLLLAAWALVVQAAGPAPAPARWRPFIGEYGRPAGTVLVYEKNGKLDILLARWFEYPLEELSARRFRYGRQTVEFTAEGLRIGSVVYARQRSAARITPLAPVEQLRREARAASPPVERGEFRKPELVELTHLDPTLRLDIRYATTNNFMGAPFYSEARAFLQRPAAEALVRANHRLKDEGFGLLIHDGYRPWSVTKMFWDATPPDKRIFVADPSKGSRHNRGCAVDLTLYDLRTGKPVEMTGGYDEMSERSFPNYPGGTSLARWHRNLLRRAMEQEGFTVFEYEWWHFDYQDWPKYPILNVPFGELGSFR
jgi:D-alanyl-D-alanine dipeptidase